MSRRLAYQLPRLRLLRRERGENESPALGGPILHATRLIVWKRDGGKCCWCGSRKELHFDHIIPRSRGGSGDPKNVELLCRACNLRKSASLTVI